MSTPSSRGSHDGSTKARPSVEVPKDLEKAIGEPADVVYSKDEQTELNTIPQHVPTNDPNLVDWDGPDDPQNPRNWSSGKKAATVVVISVVTFIT